ncbi:hypothetical protein MSG28_008305 [Choristoneura fumiferana]|uniref:Uncharacterized protein n=1 Tax=Choristoneura fumiferana TaxID=7141 RepID=A0ACC0JAU5_CHOFU|nr:hypothetical protein MSG28_008305 [Choristoneura fumiferana]
MATLKSGPEAEHALEQLMPALPELMHRDDNHTQPEEVVTWIVMDKPIAISDNQYKYFSKIDIGNAVYNYRSLHPTNRIVYRSMASCASIASPTFLGFLVILIGCATSTLASSIGDGLCMVLDMKRKIFGESVKACSKLLN